MAVVRVTSKGSKAARDRIARIEAAMAPRKIDPVVDQAAWQTHARLVRQTPKKWFGQVRAGWVVIRYGVAARLVVNRNKIMLFLEEGTKAHGPREIYGPLKPGQPRKKKALFIPLTRKAANATQGIYGVGSTIKVTRHTQGAASLSKVRAIFQRTQSVRKGRTTTGSRALIFGQDYVLAKRVRGIRAMKIVVQERPRARALLKRLMKAYLHQAIRGGGNARR